ncbi:MAG TPA: VC0807 family protein [Actinomycetota bacterium]
MFQLPRLTTLARHAIPHVLEGTVVPAILFYGALRLVGPGGALAAALLWSYAAVLRRVVLRRRIPGLLLLGTFALTVRTVTAAVTGSMFVYFLQPTIGTVATAAAFLASVPTGRPLAERLAQDFLPLPPSLVSHPVARRLFVRISVLWAFVLTANAAVTIVLLVTEPLTTFVIARSLFALVLMGGAVAASTVWFRRTLRRHGLLGPGEPVGA